MKRGTLLATAIAAALIAGCGGGDEAEETTPSALTRFAPPNSLLFGEGSIRPEGELDSNLDAIVEKFPRGGELGELIVSELDRSLQEEDPEASYTEDVEPWLGEHGAFFFNAVVSGAGDEVTFDGCALLETTDSEEATAKIRELAQEGGTKQLESRNYEGTSYDFVSPEQPDDLSAFAVVEDVALFCTEPGFQAAIDASGGDSLEAEQEYADFRAEGDEVLASFYLDGEELLEAIPPGPEFSEQDRQAFESAFGDYLKEPAMAALEVDEDTVSFETSSATTPGSESVADQTPLLEAGPEAAWAAFGVSDVGKSAGRFLEQAPDLGIPAAEFEQFRNQLREGAGIELDDFADIGDLAFFAAGESLVELMLGGVVEVPDAAARDRLTNGLRTAVERDGAASVSPLDLEGAEGFSIQPREFPVPINVASQGDRVVIAGGDETTEQLLSGDGGLADSELFRQAEEGLGEGFGVNLLLDFAPVLTLAESLGAADDPDFQEAKPYLEAIEYVAAGSRLDGDRSITRFLMAVP